MSEQEIRIGQVWRRKGNGKHIRIVSQGRDYFGPCDDWGWMGHDYRARGQSFGNYIRRDCELVEENGGGDV